MREKDIESRLVREVKRLGGLSYKFTSPTTRGVPDRIVIMPGGCVCFVELKTDVGRLTELQKYTIDEMRKRGADVRVLYGLKAVTAFVAEIEVKRK